MKFLIPIFIEVQQAPDSKRISYVLRPLFLPLPREQNQSLSKGMRNLVSEITKRLGELDQNASHDQLAQWTYCPEVRYQEVEVALTPKKTGVRSKYPVVLLPMFNRQLAYVPSLPNVWFELQAGEDLTVKTEDVLRRRQQDLERQNEVVDVSEGQLIGSASVSYIEIEFQLTRSWKPKKTSTLALIGERESISGREALETVGRCLDWDYPDELQRALRREDLVRKILAIWQQADRLSFILIGPRKTGKTALLHECIYRRRAESNLSRSYSHSGTTWHVSPQRLIAGMSYVGQWEERLLAILEWCRQQQVCLYLDDVLGLFQAGITTQSKHCLADLLKPFLERREVALIAEMTPEAWRLLRERDRSFADLFQVIQVPETSERDTLDICLAQRQKLEERHECKIALEIIPLVIDLARRYVRDAVFPGKAVHLMKQLVLTKTDRAINREDVLLTFHQSSGLPLGFLNDRQKLNRLEVIEGIGQGVVGQSEAVAAAADAICVAKARLNEIDRPLGCFLFLGPTGVGKTQCAKAIAQYLFGDPERLLRIDLNEHVGGDAVGRLVGTFGQPEGILTSAIRRQPYSVVLLDEVEKANPEVLDLLLQVLGEARLTDALGRTADFTNAMIILTSNLGAAVAGRSLGFGQDSEQIAHSFRKAAEKFFRPEFFNRIDRVIPFGVLGRSDIEKIARQLLSQVQSREGLKRWHCELRVSAEVIQTIIERGYDPQLGARALKRAIERTIVHPIGLRLAAIKPGHPVLIRLLAKEQEVIVQPNELTYAKKELRPNSGPAGNLRGAASDLLAAIHGMATRLGKVSPLERIDQGQISSKHHAYYAAQEQLVQIRDQAQCFQEAMEMDATSPETLNIISRRVARTRSLKGCRYYASTRQVEVSNLLAEQAMREFVQDLEQNSLPDAPLVQLEALLRETAWLNVLVDACERASATRALILVYGAEIAGADSHHNSRTVKSSKPVSSIARTLQARLAPEPGCAISAGLLKATVEQCGLECEWLNEGELIVGPETLMIEERCAIGLIMSGPGARELARALAGTELSLQRDNKIQLRQVIALELTDNDAPLQAAHELLARHADYLRNWSDLPDYPGDKLDPLAFGPITQITDRRAQSIVDVASGLVLRTDNLIPEDFRRLILARHQRLADKGGVL